MSAENILKTMHHGDIFSPDDEDAKIEFAGKTWLVKSFVGNPESGGVLTIEPTKTTTGLAEVSVGFITAGIALLVSANADTPDVREAIRNMVDSEFDRASTFLSQHRASRGKPS